MTKKTEQTENYTLLHSLFCAGPNRHWHLRTIADRLLHGSSHKRVMECSVGQESVQLTLLFETWKASNDSVAVMKACREKLASLYGLPVIINVVSKEPKQLP